MSALDALNIQDLRPRLSVRTNPPDLVRRGIISRRERAGAVKGVCGHYNGPALTWLPNAKKEIEFVVNVDCPNHQSRIGMDSLAYHFVIPSDGTIWQTRDLKLISWHCANAVGNESYIAVHLPIGEGQKPTAAQWDSYKRLSVALSVEYGFPLKEVKGHQEFSPSLCPGLLMPMIKEFRSAVAPPASLTGMLVAAPPRISLQTFIDVLTKAQSPALPEAEGMYYACVHSGIDPAFILAVFQHESTYGKAGICLEYDTKNVGNVRSVEVAGSGVVIQTRNANFVRYPTWVAGVVDLCARFKGKLYAGAGLVTVEQIFPKYAPTSDKNNPDVYIRKVIAAINGWASGSPTATTRWQVLKAANLRQAPYTSPTNVVRLIEAGAVIDVDLVKIDGDSETVNGDNRWLHLANGEGFVWAGNCTKLT